MYRLVPIAVVICFFGISTPVKAAASGSGGIIVPSQLTKPTNNQSEKHDKTKKAIEMAIESYRNQDGIVQIVEHKMIINAPQLYSEIYASSSGWALLIYPEGSLAPLTVYYPFQRSPQLDKILLEILY